MSRALVLVLCFAFVPSCTYAARLPLLRAFFGRQTFGESFFMELVTRLNASGGYSFSPAFRNEKVNALYSDRNMNLCWIKFYELDESADALARENGEFRQAVFRYGNIVGYCPQGDTAGLAEKVKLWLVESGKWKEEKP